MFLVIDFDLMRIHVWLKIVRLPTQEIVQYTQSCQKTFVSKDGPFSYCVVVS